MTDDDGSITVLTIGLVAVLLALVVAVTDASAVFLARRDVASACDSAAAAAAQAVDRTVLYAGGAGERLPLDLDDARQRVADWQALQHEPGLIADVTGLDDGATTVLLTCRRPERPPLRSVIDLPAVTVIAHAQARSPFSQ